MQSAKRMAPVEPVENVGEQVGHRSAQRKIPRLKSFDARVEKLVQPFQHGLKKGDHVQIWYDAASQTTSVMTPHGRATIPGRDFMKETWSIWFGKIDQPELTQSLMSDLR